MSAKGFTGVAPEGEGRWGRSFGSNAVTLLVQGRQPPPCHWLSAPPMPIAWPNQHGRPGLQMLLLFLICLLFPSFGVDSFSSDASGASSGTLPATAPQ